MEQLYKILIDVGLYLNVTKSYCSYDIVSCVPFRFPSTAFQNIRFSLLGTIIQFVGHSYG